MVDLFVATDDDPHFFSLWATAMSLPAIHSPECLGSTGRSGEGARCLYANVTYIELRRKVGFPL